MFTGIIQELGTLASRQDLDGDVRLEIEVPDALAERTGNGDSVAVNGVCLTVAEQKKSHLVFDISAETLSVTRLGELGTGAHLNLEWALSASGAMGGHFVTGHVDGVGEVLRIEQDGRSHRMEVKAPEPLARYIAKKGCITVDGVSLTVNEVNGARFVFNVVPHTWSATNMQHYAVGTLVHLEVDIIARYLERLTSKREAAPMDEDITTDYLSKQGFAPPALDEEEEDVFEETPGVDPGDESDSD